ncbi:MAG: hypothetical protein V2A77_01015 [Pseudomonadota bacterium]
MNDYHDRKGRYCSGDGARPCRDEPCRYYPGDGSESHPASGLTQGQAGVIVTGGVGLALLALSRHLLHTGVPAKIAAGETCLAAAIPMLAEAGALGLAEAMGGDTSKVPDLFNLYNPDTWRFWNDLLSKIGDSVMAIDPKDLDVGSKIYNGMLDGMRSNRR